MCPTVVELTDCVLFSCPVTALCAVGVACLIGVVKYERVSTGVGALPKLFKIDPADRDRAESAARAMSLSRGVASVKKGKASAQAAAKGGAPASSSGADGSAGGGSSSGGGAGVASGGLGGGSDGGDDDNTVTPMMGALKHIRLRATSAYPGLRSKVTQFTVG